MTICDVIKPRYYQLIVAKTLKMAVKYFIYTLLTF